MDFKYSEPKAFSSEICEKINECFIDLNLTLLSHVHNHTAEEKEMWDLFNGVAKNIIVLRERKLANLGDIFGMLTFVLPSAYQTGYLGRLKTNLDSFVANEAFDLREYTEIVLLINQQYCSILGKVQDTFRMFQVRSDKKSVLDSLKCRNEIIEIFNTVKILEASGTKSAFADLYNKKLKELLQNNTSLFEPRNIGDEKDPILETPGEINHRVYKHINKLYSTWKRHHEKDVEKLINYLEKNFWNADIKNTEEIAKGAAAQLDERCLERMYKLLDDVHKYIAQMTTK